MAQKETTLQAILHAALERRRQAHSLRTMAPVAEGMVDFSSNDYLGLARDAHLLEQAHAKVMQLRPLRGGATGSRLLSGTHAYMCEVEDKLASVFDAEACLVFNSGYQANTALLATIPQRGDTILCDELIHASLREGARLSFAGRHYFRHNDLEDLAQRLRKARGNCFVVVESVYSMDGDRAPLKEILDLCGQYGAHVVVDEAHSTGLWGARGEGLLCVEGLHRHPALLARVYTFGKAIGGHGACVAGSRLLIDYLLNFARAFIYTTALPLHSFAYIEAAFDKIATTPALQQRLWQIVHYYKQKQKQVQAAAGLHFWETQSPIQVVEVGGNERTRALSAYLQQQGLDVRAVLAPTVPAGKERLRICLHAFNTFDEVDKLFESFRSWNL
ncbi:MAG: 8-amino-7-oxononanoate synthase [Thermonema sp.]|uniref:aminotransferase class I/II-fold pyridoxal phosphate-dependent enzyme n=1 Tax=Thermonema sp. TaxID=2231181 RepID=UPI0021DB895D|nr:8-amino-7-oxononanoate synthase [Thermonema sp.]GIV39073.1 MAG: 8-amino-7-oxononanoate synthase [Thermonema sp.]